MHRLERTRVCAAGGSGEGRNLGTDNLPGFQGKIHFGLFFAMCVTREVSIG